MKEDILKQGEKQKTDIEDIIFVKEGGDFINRFNKLQEECSKEFGKIDDNIGILNKLQVKERFVKKRFESKEIKKTLKEGGVDDEEIKKIQKKLIDNHQKITKFFIEENEICKKEKRNNEKKKELKQLEKEVNNKVIDKISNKPRGSLEFNINIKIFESAINDIYKEITDRKGEIKEKTEQKIQEIKKQYKNILLNEKRYFMSYKDEKTKEKLLSDLLDKIIEKVEKEWELKKQEEKFKKDKEENIKMLADAFGFKVKDKDLDEFLELSDKVNEETLKAVEERAIKEGETDERKIKEAEKKAKKELKEAKKRGRFGGFLLGSGHCFFALLLFWMSKKIKEGK